LFGVESPSGKLPVTFPKMVGQIPIYYNHKNTGRPPIPESWVYIDDIPVRNRQSSLGFESHYLDAGYEPQYPFGYGLSYTQFEYNKLTLSSETIKSDESLTVSAEIKNTGSVEADEIVQLYIRDLVADITRPVRELKGFQRIRIKPGESKTVQFELHADDLAFHNQKMQLVTEPGAFHVWIAPDSDSGLKGTLELLE
jgi:beta-glucosidase